MAKDSFDIERTWRPFLHEGGDPPERCPSCDRPLHVERVPYAVALRLGSGMEDGLIVGGPDTGFCQACGIAVVDTQEVEETIAQTQPRGGAKFQYAIVGLIDLDEPPEDADESPFGDDEPPLIEFGEPWPNQSRQQPRRTRRPTKPKSKSSRKRRRRRRKKPRDDS